MRNQSVSILSGGGGEFLNRLYNGRDTVIPDDNRRGGGDNATVTNR